jgi:pilus assembly protein Flp/PilA
MRDRSWMTGSHPERRRGSPPGAAPLSRPHLDVRPAPARPNQTGGRLGSTNKKEEFTAMKALIRNLVVREEGQDLVEYALLAALLSIVSITALLALGPTIANVWTQINAAISGA